MERSSAGLAPGLAWQENEKAPISTEMGAFRCHGVRSMTSGAPSSSPGFKCLDSSARVQASASVIEQRIEARQFGLPGIPVQRAIGEQGIQHFIQLFLTLHALAQLLVDARDLHGQAA